MKDLFNRTWFRPALLGLFALLQLALLFTVALLRPDFDAAENAYLQLIAGIENSTESSATSGNMLDICAGWGVPPLYPLLLQAASAALRGTGISIRAIPGLFNLFLFLLTWPALYFCTRQFIRNPWAAPIIPFLYGISAGAAFTVRTAGPYMLTTLLCVFAVQLLAFIQKKTAQPIASCRAVSGHPERFFDALRVCGFYPRACAAIRRILYHTPPLLRHGHNGCYVRCCTFANHR